ncbi:MAG: DegT/DnrJ/EryC1/StrS aminotransferase family protein [Proteobacteria bacterium]|nr:DegT/DnrJ/EryC1/StrS aminotransferase family protein [Pseudomonadota bacterium]
MTDFLPFTRPTLDEATIAEVVAVLRSGWITSGPKVAELERALAAYLGGGRQVRVMTSATGGMEMALKAAGIGRGDEVVVPAMSFAASANVVVRVGARPVFVDVELRSRNASAASFEAALTPRTRALMPVHFSGLAVDMDPVNALAAARGLRVIEDAAHAIGTRYRGRLIGSFGDIVSFSFHANKNMTTVEGGALSFADPALALPLDRERFHGITKDAAGNVDVFDAGGKYNLTDVAAAVGIGQLRRLEEFNARRRALAARYHERLAPRLDPDQLPPAGDDGHAWHMYAVLVPFARLGTTRDGFVAAMRARGIGLGVHYPSIPGLTYYRQLGWDPEAFPNAARIGAETVTLPLFPAMADGDVDRVCDALLELMQR